MKLSETGESRVRGYLFMLDRALRASPSARLAADAVREVDAHIRDRVAESSGMPNERDALETILARLGSPSVVARAYSLEMTMDEAAVGGRLVAVVRSVFQAAVTSGGGFFAAWLLFFGYAGGTSMIVMAALKPIFPNNVGIWTHEGLAVGAQFPAPDGLAPHGGYWIIPIFLCIGLLILTVTHRIARRRAEVVRDRLAQRRTGEL
ncbi:MAG TPA: hypothetical protein VFZ36_00240 [Vicinamibacterales bacterium]